MAEKESRIGICPQTREECEYPENPKECFEYSFQTCDYVILTTPANLPLIQEISDILQKDIPNPVKKFPDGEIDINSEQVIPNLHRRNVYIIQSGFPDPNERWVETQLLADTIHRARANEINVLFTYMPYTRKDKKDQKRMPISAAVFLDAVKHSGDNNVNFVNLDMHTEQEAGFVKAPVDNLYGSYVFIPKLDELGLVGKEAVYASTDFGGAKRCKHYADHRGGSVGIVYKQRDLNTGSTEALGLFGDIKDKRVVILDDEISSAGSFKNAAVALKENGAREIYGMIVHGKLTGNALENIENSPIEKLYITNSIRQKEEVLNHPKIEVVSIGPLIAETILRFQTGESLSEGLIK